MLLLVRRTVDQTPNRGWIGILSLEGHRLNLLIFQTRIWHRTKSHLYIDRVWSGNITQTMNITMWHYLHPYLKSIPISRYFLGGLLKRCEGGLHLSGGLSSKSIQVSGYFDSFRGFSSKSTPLSPYFVKGKSKVSQYPYTCWKGGSKVSQYPHTFRSPWYHTPSMLIHGPPIIGRSQLKYPCGNMGKAAKTITKWVTMRALISE